MPIVNIDGEKIETGLYKLSIILTSEIREDWKNHEILAYYNKFSSFKSIFLKIFGCNNSCISISGA